jgi:hypothetical protein
MDYTVVVLGAESFSVHAAAAVFFELNLRHLPGEAADTASRAKN